MPYDPYKAKFIDKDNSSMGSDKDSFKPNTTWPGKDVLLQYDKNGELKNEAILSTWDVPYD